MITVQGICKIQFSVCKKLRKKGGMPPLILHFGKKGRFISLMSVLWVPFTVRKFAITWEGLHL